MTVGREGNKHNKTPEKEIRKTTKRGIWKEAEHGRKKKNGERHRYSNSSRRCRSLFFRLHMRERKRASPTLIKVQHARLDPKVLDFGKKKEPKRLNIAELRRIRCKTIRKCAVG